MNVLRMHTTLVLSFWLFGPFATQAFAAENRPSPIRKTVVIDGKERNYDILLPENYDRDETCWLVVAFRGRVDRYWPLLRDAELRAIVMRPDFLMEPRGYMCFPSLGEGEALLKMVEHLQASHRVRPKLLLTGFSAGANFAHRFAYEHPDKVWACAPYAAGSWSTPDGRFLVKGLGEVSDADTLANGKRITTEQRIDREHYLNVRSVNAGKRRAKTNASKVPFMVMCGTRDIGRLQNSKDFADSLMVAGFRVETAWPDAKHELTTDVQRQIVEFFKRETAKSDSDSAAVREEMFRRYLDFPNYVSGGRIRPHWLSDGNRFWFSEASNGNTNRWIVDPVKDSMEPYEVEEVVRPADNKPPQAALRTWKDQFNNVTSEISSPDGKWRAGIENHGIYIRSASGTNKGGVTSTGQRDRQWVLGMTEVGNSGVWSPNSRYLAAVQMDYRGVPTIPIVDYLNPGEETVRRVNYAKAGQKWPKIELSVLDVSTSKVTKVDVGDEVAYLRILDWKSDSTEIYLFAQNRYANKQGKLDGQLLALDAEDGTTRIVLNQVARGRFYLFDESDSFIWNTIGFAGGRLHLYDLEGQLIQPRLNGNLPVTRLLSVDEENGWLYFLGHGSPESPVDEHLYRVKISGGDAERLTETTGVRRIEFSPSGDYFLETHSSIERPPTVDLRKSEGRLVRTVSRSDTRRLLALEWTPGEPFVVKDASGDREIQGVLYKPANFDASRKYPLIQFINQSGRFHLQRGFIPDGYNLTAQAFAQLGFVTFVARRTYKDSDGMDVERGFAGTATADSQAVIRQLQELKPYIDSNRVGIYGSSMNGFYSILGILEAPDVYDVAVAVYPITDMSAHIGNHSFLGPPGENPEGYKASSVIPLAERLRGKLMLVHGTADVAVPISHTMKLADALIRADKQFDMLIMPEESHTTSNISDGYGLDRAMRYFVEHLKP